MLLTLVVVWFHDFVRFVTVSHHFLCSSFLKGLFYCFTLVYYWFFMSFFCSIYLLTSFEFSLPILVTFFHSWMLMLWNKFSFWLQLCISYFIDVILKLKFWGVNVKHFLTILLSIWRYFKKFYLKCRRYWSYWYLVALDRR